MLNSLYAFLPVQLHCTQTTTTTGVLDPKPIVESQIFIVRDNNALNFKGFKIMNKKSHLWFKPQSGRSWSHVKINQKKNKSGMGTLQTAVALNTNPAAPGAPLRKLHCVDFVKKSSSHE